MVERPGSRKVGAEWAEPTSDEFLLNYRATLTLRFPVRRDWSPAQRKLVEQVVADAALHALHSMESDGVKS